MQVELLNDQGQAASNVDVPETVFGRDYNEALIHQLVVAYQANARQGTRAQKDRQMVKHSTKKPFKQKGTGNARAGMTSSPLWRGGGRIFPNSPDGRTSSTIAIISTVEARAMAGLPLITVSMNGKSMPAATKWSPKALAIPSTIVPTAAPT